MTLYVVSVNFNLFSVSLYVVLITGFLFMKCLGEKRFDYTPERAC